jgi:hypothetical protein
LTRVLSAENSIIVNLQGGNAALKAFGNETEWLGRRVAADWW